MTDREDDFNRTAKDSEGRKVQQELERQLRELGDTMSDSFRHGFEGRGEEIGDRVWDVGRAAVNAAGYGISEAGRAFQAGKQEYQKRAEEARSSASGMTDWARNFFAKKPEPTAIENIRTDLTDDDYENYLPDASELPASLQQFINDKYPTCRIIETETEHNRTEVDIIHENRSKEVIFDASGNWLNTHYDVRQNEVETAVMNALKTSAYADYIIDDIERYETPALF